MSNINIDDLNKEIIIPQIEVIYPDENIIKIKEHQIIENVIKEKTIIEKLKEVYIGPGLNTIFYQCKISWGIGMMAYLVAIIIYWSMESSFEYKEFLMLFPFPIMYFTFVGISYWSEEQNEVVDLKKSMKYSFYYIICLRVFWVSIIAVGVNTFTIMAFSTGIKNELSVCSIGTSSLCIFSMLSIYLYRKFGRYYNVLFLSLMWIMFCFILANGGEKVHYVLFQVVPTTVHIIVTICLFVSYVIYIRKVEKTDAYIKQCYQRLW